MRELVEHKLKNVWELREHNCDVYFEKENIHTLDLYSEMFLALYSTFAQIESLYKNNLIR